MAAVALVVAWSRVESVAGLYLVFAGLGLVSATVLYEPAFAVVVRWFRVHRARALLGVTMVAGFASTIFLPATQALEQTVGWRATLLVLAAVLAAGTVLPHAVVLRRDPGDLGLRPDGASGAPGPAGPPGPPPAPLRVTAPRVLADARFRLLTLAYAAHTLAVVVVAVHLVPYLREQGHSAAFAAGTTGALGVLSVTGRVVVTGAVRRRPVASVTAAAFAAQAAAALVLVLHGATAAGAVLFVVLFGLGFGVGTITRPALLADLYGVRDYATLSALVGIALTLARTAGPVTAGLARTATGNYTAVLVAVAATCLVAAGAVGSLGGPQQGRREPSAASAASASREASAARSRSPSGRSR